MKKSHSLEEKRNAKSHPVPRGCGKYFKESRHTSPCGRNDSESGYEMVIQQHPQLVFLQEQTEMRATPRNFLTSSDDRYSRPAPDPYSMPHCACPVSSRPDYRHHTRK
ncbi:hypothetical protein AVEN_225305-1 [Araneus ventricosus]|uniref:Uncharacterized protein n=1 Tax=Araneus ventricosus TaxID=182803 RepID=A0A4Y2ALX1_ARAVE|nr:hypothetical protein AVEN_225305-1 [Araneus ventricosus]